MNRKAVLSLMLAILLPLAGYWIVKFYSKDAVHIPRKYFYDSVDESAGKKGKKQYDTVWHSLKDIHLVNQLGKEVSLSDAQGKILVINFFFTHCPTICPGLTRSMKKLQDSFVKTDSIVQFISISVDPERDSVPQLRAFADRFNVNHDNWWFVTGNKKEIYDFAIRELKANIADAEVDTAFIHTENFFLVDSNRIVRGWYNGFDQAKQEMLVRDIPTLLLEKDKKSPSILRNFIPYLPVIFIGIGVVMVIMILLQRNRTYKY